jgi:hypothetical protein
MNITEELQIQRDFLAKNQWVNRAPLHSHEACLAYRNDIQNLICISGEALNFLEKFLCMEYGRFSLPYVNDTLIKDKEEALSILDKAIIASEEIV